MSEQMGIYSVYSKVHNYYCHPLPKTLEIIRRISTEDIGEGNFLIFRYVSKDSDHQAHFVNVDDDTDIREIPEQFLNAAFLQSTLDEMYVE